MGIPRNIPGLNDQIINLIKHKAWSLVGTIGFTISDRDDLEQELVLDLIKRLPKFDPNRAQLMTFVARIIDNKIASMIEARKSCFFDFRMHSFSLNEPSLDIDGYTIERGDEIDEDDYLMRTGARSHASIDLIDLRADLSHVISDLSPELQELCRRLQTQNVTDISTSIGVARYKIYAEISRLRIIFEEAGLDDYL